MLLAALFANSAVFVGPLTGLVGGGDISIFVGFGVALVGYYVTMRSRVRPAPESARTLAPVGEQQTVAPAAEVTPA
jgi:purine-cytosine permease-like protein